MPQHSRRILQHSHESRDIHLVSLNRWSSLSLLNGLQLPQVGESRESPVALFGDESMVGICDGKKVEEKGRSVRDEEARGERLEGGSEEREREETNSRDTVKTDGSLGLEIARAN